MKTKLTTLLILFVSTIIFAQDEWQTLEQDNYSISYPKDWVSSDQKPQPTMQFLLLSDEKSQKEDQFRENLNLTTEALGGQTLSIEEYTKISQDQITAQIPGSKVLANKAIKINEQEAREVVWSADFGNGMILQFKQIFIIDGDKAYVLTFSSTTAEYDSYIEVGDKILKSFKLTK